ncbi:MAG: DUF1549 domain-containing protein, partial [Verrucomicrobiota bacterium]|nr:DUF1549 domain-containing protein [Verrucomicrobiota bacterium]
MTPFRYILILTLIVAFFGNIVIAAEKNSAMPPPNLAEYPASSSPVDFKKEIWPLLQKYCHQCHGPEKQKGGLRLDRKESALSGGDSGASIIPGESGASRIIHLMVGVEDEIMPPKGERVKKEEISLLRGWIDQGANWPDEFRGGEQKKNDHWSFRAPVKPQVPEVQGNSWVSNPIDAFVLARLEREQIQPSPAAEKSTLLRRLSLDLTGLPPSQKEIETYLGDHSAEAYERLVDRLLASPHFGEQWARHWLDLARYADSDGYEKDFDRPHAWRWRDWVIDSINEDQPFDQFTQEQIAGDLLPEANLEQKVATGFHRNSLLNREGGVDIEEDRTKIVVDRVSTVGTVWLGLTVGCAECHSHKYDPISQKEFYQLYAYFNGTDDRDIKAPLKKERQQILNKEDELTMAKKKYATSTPEFEEWAKSVAGLEQIWHIPAQEDYELPTFGANNGANLYPQEDGSFLVTGMVENKTHYIMMLNTRLHGITGIRVEAMTDEMLPKLGPGWAANGNFLLNELHVESAPLKALNELKTNRISSVSADYSQHGFAITNAIDGDFENGGWAIDMPHLPMHGVDRAAVFILEEAIDHPEGTRLKVNLVQHRGESHTLGRVRVSYTTAEPSRLKKQAVPGRIRAIAEKAAADRTLDEQVELKRYWQATFQPDAKELVEISKALAESPGIKG